eukprot:CAMPEP_0172670106 /NCGR_PEP_ID=MMETSP1074-20121228/10099_1 /TAXON_ID=2916 /ORGANISM="Ceratium fusus, Strain PA161109" /LENGTH=127 /DNA_ID=CAMNT_0013486973 /DNA_START=138 /DNA_END=522 /DNA_ORIENTATION=+
MKWRTSTKGSTTKSMTDGRENTLRENMSCAFAVTHHKHSSKTTAGKATRRKGTDPKDAPPQEPAASQCPKRVAKASLQDPAGLDSQQGQSLCSVSPAWTAAFAALGFPTSQRAKQLGQSRAAVAAFQ